MCQEKWSKDPADTINKELFTGEVEIKISSFESFV